VSTLQVDVAMHNEELFSAADGSAGCGQPTVLGGGCGQQGNFQIIGANWGSGTLIPHFCTCPLLRDWMGPSS